jgi:NADPH:quinone reductase-like Zn-dependent oxidoreductase
MSKQTRVWQFDEPGGPERLVLRDVPEREPGYGEVRIRVESLSINRSDILWLANTYLESPRTPGAGIGHEIAGTIEAVGPGAGGVAIGDRVSTFSAFSLNEHACFGETAVVPARALVPTPVRFDIPAASSFAVAYFTAYFALIELCRLQAPQTVVITAATGTPGFAAIQLAKQLGARVIATTRTRAKVDALRAAGANEVIAIADEPALNRRVLELTAGRGADVVYDCVVGGVIDKLADAVRVRGHYVVYGLLEPQGAAFSWWSAFTRSFRLHVYKVFDYTGNGPLGLAPDEAAIVRGKEMLLAGFADGSLRPPPIDRVLRGLERVPDALRHMLTNTATGKIVVVL